MNRDSTPLLTEGEPGHSPPAGEGVSPKATVWWEKTCLRTFKPANARRKRQSPEMNPIRRFCGSGGGCSSGSSLW